MAGTRIAFKSNGGTTDGYLATPESGSGPGVIVIQEWWGLVDHIKDLADRLAGEGFVTLAPDLYHGQRTTDPDEAAKMMMALNIAQTEKDLRGAVDFLLGQSLASSRVGIIGFCMGGQLALFAACQNPQIGACVDFYGIHPNVKPDYGKLSGPVLAFFGEKDHSNPPEARKGVEDGIKAAGKSIEMHVYPADHAFFNDTRPEVYDAAAATDTWKRALDFFHKNLG